MKKYRAPYQTVPFIIAGDWNCSPLKLPVKIRVLDLHPLFLDNTLSTHREGKLAIDNMFVSGIFQDTH